MVIEDPSQDFFSQISWVSFNEFPHPKEVIIDLLYYSNRYNYWIIIINMTTFWTISNYNYNNY